MESKKIRSERRKGRGANSNPDIRFERLGRVFADDGWDLDDDQPQIRTEIAIERPRSVITKNASPDLSFDRSINPYRGCEHGCIYCFARPSHAYLGLSPGLDFETRLVARPEAPKVLVKELGRKAYKPRVIAIGTNTDPYQPVEKKMKIMRGILEVLRDHQHPVGVVTKGVLIERDLDILAEMGQAGLARVGISVTTLDPDVARRMEPRAPAPKRRLQVIERLAKAGCPVRIMASPMVPGLTDQEMEAILKAGKEAGAETAGYILLRLPREVAGLFWDWLAEHYPNRASRVMRAVRDTQGGKDYDPDWATRMTGTGTYADLMRLRFKVTAARLDLSRELSPLRTDLFKVPAKLGDQLSLF